MDLETLKTILETRAPLMSGYALKRDRRMGLELVGPCPLCEPQRVLLIGTEQKIVNHDRFHAWVQADGLIHWWCRHEHHDFTQKALFAYLGIDDDGDYAKYCRTTATTLYQVPTAAMYGQFTFAEVNRYFDSRPEYVRDYWGRWGISPLMVQAMRLGYIDFPFDDGRRFAGFTIPHFFHTGDGAVLVKGIHVRRDDSVANNGIRDKYHALKGSNLAGLYMDKAMCLPDETRIASSLDAAILCEDERTALCLNTYLHTQGIKRVAVAAYHPEAGWDKFLSKCVQHSLLKFVLQDNDGGAGLSYVVRVQKAAGPGTTSLMHPTFKQLSDLAAAEGLNAAGDWLMAAIEKSIMG